MTRSDTQLLVLASTSPYRRELLSRLGMPFVAVAPDCDERRRPGESPDVLVRRLAEEKARSLARVYPNALIIGCDQVGVCGAEVLTKPGTHARAAAQLRALTGLTVQFVTGLCLLNTGSGRCHVGVETYAVRLRPLADAAIDLYLRKDKPYDCAGAFKAEGLGIALFESMSGRDPNTLIGLPLIRLVDFLAAEGRSPLA